MNTQTDYPEYRFSDLITENPFRFLEYCEDHRVTPTVVGLLRGMQSRERLTLWARAEHERYGNRRAVAEAIGKRLAHVAGHDATEGDLDDVPTTPNTDNTRELAATPKTSTTESTSESPAHHHDDDTEDFESEVESSYQIVSGFDDESKLVELLTEETDREEPRQHVVAAINRRLTEVRSADDTSTDTETPDTQKTVSA